VSSVDQALARWAEDASEEELEAGPRLADLGGPDAVLAEAEALVAGPQLPYLLAALAHEMDETPSEEIASLLTESARGLSHPHSAWILADALDIICTYPRLVQGLGASVMRELAATAENALAGKADVALAHPSIVALLRLAVTKQTPPHRLLAVLSEITGDEPVDALERLPILIGVAHDHLPDSEALLGVLSRLENHPALSSAARADAAFELAVASERAAFEAEDPGSVERHLRLALMRFIELDEEHEARLDARAHRTAIEAVLVFSETTAQDHPPDERLAEVLARLDRTTAHLEAWRQRMHTLDWLSARALTQSAWSKLVTTLHTAHAHLTEPSWYNPAESMNDLLEIYLASRSVYGHTPTSPGVIALINPTVEASFVRNDGLLHHLEHALAFDEQFKGNPDATALQVAVQARRRELNSETATGAVPGKALEERPALANLFSSKTTPDFDKIDPRLLDEFEKKAIAAKKGYTPTGNALVDRILERLLAVISTSPAWQSPVNHYFTTLLEQLVRFLHQRFDAQANLYRGITEYLGPATKKDHEGKLIHWSEKNLQDDFHQYLCTIFTPASIEREKWDVAAGRADITYTPEPGSRFVTEVKWRTSDWQQDSIKNGYLAQASNYTVTGPPFAILLVGDYSGHLSGWRSLDDSIWTFSHSISDTEIPRIIIAAVLPTGRPTPSALKLPKGAPSRYVHNPSTA
jgi:hypothetical protein